MQAIKTTPEAGQESEQTPPRFTYDFTPFPAAGFMVCHVDGCEGRVRLFRGQGVCDRCAMAHRLVKSIEPVLSNVREFKRW